MLRDAHGVDRGNGPGLSRRTVLGGVTVVGFGALAGCLGDDDSEGPTPITIESGQPCDNCTMDIVDHPGPVGQAFYDDPGAVLGGGTGGGHGDDGHDYSDEGDDHDNTADDDLDQPAQFCSSSCTYTFVLNNEADHEPTATYLTDYSTVEYNVSTADEELEISNHVEADAFERAENLTFVVDSSVLGAMGRSLIGFSSIDDAEDFQEEYGGTLYEHDEIDQQLIMSLM